MSGIDVSAATEALNAAGGVETLMQQEMHGQAGTVAPVVPTPPAPQTADTTPVTENQTQSVNLTDIPEGPRVKRDPATGRWVSAVEEAAAPEEFSNVDPNTLAPELQSIYKSLQADYTRKTQEIAAQRKQYEGLGDPEQLKQAAQIYQQLQDPAYWPQLHAELTQGLQQLGYSPQQAAQLANEEVVKQQGATQGGADLSALENDPDLAPVAQMVKSLQDEVSQLKSTYTSQVEQAKQAQLQQALIGEITRQENAIRQTNPHYNDGDINNVYELASFYDGNLFDAQKRYEEIQQATIERYLSQKSGANSGSTVLGGGDSISYKPKGQPKDLDEGLAMALEAIAQVEAQEL